jgi:hypothetical protein
LPEFNITKLSTLFYIHYLKFLVYEFVYTYRSIVGQE